MLLPFNILVIISILSQTLCLQFTVTDGVNKLNDFNVNIELGDSIFKKFYSLCLIQFNNSTECQNTMVRFDTYYYDYLTSKISERKFCTYRILFHTTCIPKMFIHLHDLSLQSKTLWPPDTMY